MKENKFKMTAYAAVRTHEADIRPLIEISQKVGMPIEAAAFIGSSPIRQYAEGWDIDVIVKKSVEAVKLAVDNDLPVMYVTEDTTRARRVMSFTARRPAPGKPRSAACMPSFSER